MYMSEYRLSWWSQFIRDFCPCLVNRPRFYKAKSAPLAKKNDEQKNHQQQLDEEEQHICRQLEASRIRMLSNRIKELECQESAILIQHLSDAVASLEDKMIGLESKIDSLTSYLHDFEDISNPDDFNIDTENQKKQQTSTKEVNDTQSEPLPSTTPIYKQGIMDLDSSVYSDNHVVSSKDLKGLEQLSSSVSTSSIQKIEVNSNGDVISES
jgi:uncharacterized coiled-coil protein SlyX